MRKDQQMNKFLSLSMAALLAGTMITLSFSEADARHKRRHNSGAAAAIGLLGGIALGAALANSDRRGNDHCHQNGCHNHNYRDFQHRHRPVVYNPQPRQRRLSYANAHEEWCFNRYRSFRAYDNTYQPYQGGRRYCRSPYND
jgi:hypothetical protein